MHSFDLKVFCAFLSFRLFSVYITSTSFVPDEYWQSLEVAHKMSYGYGHLTWEWDKRIRSCSYPFIFHLMYSILPDSTIVIIYAPKVLQAVLSSIGDFYAYKFAYDYFGQKCALWTTLNIIASWFLFYCSPRTITNMAEASLTTCGFYFYPWPKTKKHRLSSIYLWFAGASVVMRSTAVVTWLPLYIWHVWRERNVFSLLKKTVFIGCIILAVMLFIDRWCFGEWVFTPYNFFLFNWKSDIGAFYGSHNFMWYYLVGLPVVLGIQVIPFMLGFLIPQLKRFYYLILWALIIFSIPSHKEFRFLLPFLHLSLIICGVVMDEIWSERMFINRTKIRKNLNVLFSALLVLVNVPLSIYMALYHQRGVIDAVLHLSKTADSHSEVIFLMPCHSTPYYSYIHKDIKMRFLTCEPNFGNEKDYIEEADLFFTHPMNWLTKNYDQNNKNLLPSHVVMFDSLHPNISEFLMKHSYSKCFSSFYSHFGHGRTGKYVDIYCK